MSILPAVGGRAVLHQCLYVFLPTGGAQAPGVPAWPMRGVLPSGRSTGVWLLWTTTVFSSTISQVGLVKADKGRVIRCISLSHTFCSCCSFKSFPLARKEGSDQAMPTSWLQLNSIPKAQTRAVIHPGHTHTHKKKSLVEPGLMLT